MNKTLKKKTRLVGLFEVPTLVITLVNWKCPP